MWELDCKEGWALKKWCFWTLVLEKTLESPLDSKEIQPVHPKGNQSWIFIGRTDVKAETPIIWPPDGKNWLIGKDLDAGKDGRQEEKRATEDEMVDSINGDEFEQTQGDSEGQGSLACCSPWGRKELDTTEGRNKWYLIPLSSSVSWSLLKFMSIESITLSSHLILCCPLLLLSSIFPSIRVFSTESALHVRYQRFMDLKYFK